MQKFLDCYKQWAEAGEMPRDGLCKSLPKKLNSLLNLLSPHNLESIIDHCIDGGHFYYWGNEDIWVYSQRDFTPLRQTIILLCAALNGEFD